jgi:hypothetical protein
MDGGVVHLCSVASLAIVLALLASSSSQADTVFFFWHSSRRASISSCAHQCDHKSGAGAGQLYCLRQTRPGSCVLCCITLFAS